MTREELYLIEILHQTTTFRDRLRDHIRLYLIEILHQTTTLLRLVMIREELYLIEILHQTTTVVISSRIIRGCILSKFYIKPQLSPHCISEWPGCILSKFYIKPQLAGVSPNAVFVVSYRNSTSNHNGKNYLDTDEAVVSYRNSTSNHNT